MALKKLNSSLADCEIDGINDPSCLYWFQLLNTLNISSHFNTGNSGKVLFPVSFCICFQPSAHEQNSTALLYPVLPGSNHYIPLQSAITLITLIILPFVCLFIRSFIRSFVHSFIYLLNTYKEEDRFSLTVPHRVICIYHI